MSSLPPYGLLLIGGGQTHQENYARAFAADRRCRLIGLADEADVPSRRLELNRQLAEELNIPYFDDLDAALQRKDVQLVSVCVETERIAHVATRGAQAGKHIYLDKPLAATAAEARSLVNAVDAAGVITQMFSLVRSSLGTRAKSTVTSGRVGELVGLHTELFFAKGKPGTDDLMRPRREQADPKSFTFIDSKRELFTIGLYPLVLFCWLTGRRVETVYGITSNYFFEEHQRNDCDDFASLLLTLEGGIDATITVGRTGWTSHPASGIHQIRIVGSEGTELIDAFRPRLEEYSSGAAWNPPESPSADDPMGFWSSTVAAAGIESKRAWRPVEPIVENDTSYFLDCIEAGRASDVPASVGAHVVEIIFAGYKSAATGQPVTVVSPQ